ncbi:MAG: hypothetical protein JWN63_2755 [Candidatus Acidoferrum typicum]|nr:hypothetical protein [Candidatus Acidoferrum typicum]
MMPNVGDVVTDKSTGDSGVVVAVITEPPDGGVRIALQIREARAASNLPFGDGTVSILNTSPERRRCSFKLATSAEGESILA